KKELIYRRRYTTRKEAVQSITNYITSRYNEKRKHSTLGYCSPNNFERKHLLKAEKQSSLSNHLA
ncbi:IS3 family transposase, partial [Peribacillus kribbensis]